MPSQQLTDRERRVLEAVIQSYVETAEPAGSRTISRRFGIGVSPATIRNTMSDLEEKGFLIHPHTSAGRVPTEMAYRAYVDSLLAVAPSLERSQHEILRGELAAGGSAIEAILRRAAQVLGVLTHELGIAIGPQLAQARLERLELVRLSAERLLMVLRLTGGAAQSIFVEVPGEIAEAALAEVSRILNERLAGLSLREIRATLADRLRDTATGRDEKELLNIFVQEGEQLFDLTKPLDEGPVLLGQTSVLVQQPEFANATNLRRLLELTDRPDTLGPMVRRRPTSGGLSITIGSEHAEPQLTDFTMVTAEFHAAGLAGVIGVIGPTRMPYEKVITLVTHTSRLLSELID